GACGLRCHSRCRRLGVPGPWCAAADARMGFHAGRYARSYDVASLGHGVSRHCHSHHRSCHQFDGRRLARRARPALEAELTPMSAEYTAALIGALGTIAAAFVGVLTWYLPSRADRRHERDAREAARRDEVKLRDQRVLDLVVALHAEILAGVL